MATTGFWPVRGKLKKVLDYADNPDKTTERKYLNQMQIHRHRALRSRKSFWRPGCDPKIDVNCL